MLPGKNGIILVALLLLIVTTVEAAPTISHCDKYIAGNTISQNHSKHIIVQPEPETIQIDTALNSHLASIADDFLRPPVNLWDSSTESSHAKSLPAVPGALFMALVGFVCVSFVKDRKVWLAALAGLLWIGQAGITILPQKCRLCFAHHLNKSWAEPTLPAFHNT